MTNILMKIIKPDNKVLSDEDIKILHHTLFEGSKITAKDSKISVALINIPCGGFGDVVNCKTFSDYLKEWYPNMKVKICTSAIDKFKSLGIKTGDLLELKSITKLWRLPQGIQYGILPRQTRSAFSKQGAQASKTIPPLDILLRRSLKHTGTIPRLICRF